jgi:hypothetical protein
MDLQERLKLAQAAGTKYSELACMFEAAITQDPQRLSELRVHASAAVRFATFVNPLTHVTIADLAKEPFIKFAAIHNPSTTTEVLDHIGLNQTAVNPVIPEIIHTHKNASEEFQVFRAITDFGILDDMYWDENDKYFYEVFYDESSNFEQSIDLNTLENLLYSHILGFIDAPDDTGEFWLNVLQELEASSDGHFSELLRTFARMPAIPQDFYECEAINRARMLAAEFTNEAAEMEKLVWDKKNLNTGVGGFYWLDSSSPRAGVAYNKNAPSEILKRIFDEESQDEAALHEYPAAILWRLAGNPSSPQEVLEGIVSLLESGAIHDEDRFSEIGLLVGEEDDANVGLAWNPSVKSELRTRVETLMKDRDLDPEEYIPDEN